MTTNQLLTEEWKEVDFSEFTPILRYSISNHGKIRSFKSHTSIDGRLLKGGILGGYPILKTRMRGKDKTFYLHKLVAQYFCNKPNIEHTFVLHLDYNKKNNKYTNLKWANKQEYLEHHKENPFIQEARKNTPKPQQGHKLNSTDVLRIKKMLANPNRKTRMKLIAKQFGISEMQLYRIKSGENWSHIKI